MSTASFHLIRHAAHGDLGQRLTGRLPGLHLSEEGQRQALGLGKSLAGVALSAVFTSPRERAQETAELACPGQTVTLADELDEIDFAAWSGQSFAELEHDPDWRVWNENRDTARTPAGDSMGDTARRVIQLIDRLRAEHRDGTIALFSHADVIKAAICHYLGLAFSAVHRFEIGPAAISSLVVGDCGGKLLCLNSRTPGGFE